MDRIQRWGATVALWGLGLVACQPGTIADGLGPPNPGSINIQIQGLPVGATAAIVVTGPGGFTTPIGNPQILSGLTPGTYTITACLLYTSPSPRD